MPITYPRALPNVPFKASRMGLNINQAAFESGLTRKLVVQNHAAGLTDRWEGILTTTALLPDQVATLSAWITSLNGRARSFLCFDPDRKMPRGVADDVNATPVVAGAGQIGRTLVASGWGVNINNLLLPGDYVQIGAGYHMILEAVNSDASGIATLNFEPAMRTSPAAAAPIIFRNPQLVARLAAPIGGWETDAMRYGELSIAWEEII